MFPDTKKIIFLDFDGPLSNVRTAAAGDQNAFDPLVIRALNKICQVSGAKIVPISTRVHRGTIDEVKDACDRFVEAGGDLAFLHEDWSVYEDHMQKDKGVNDWMSRHEPLTHFAVIEDEDLGLPNQVLVCEANGVLMDDFEKICELLGFEFYQAIHSYTTTPNPIVNQFNFN